MRELISVLIREDSLDEASATAVAAPGQVPQEQWLELIGLQEPDRPADVIGPLRDLIELGIERTSDKYRYPKTIKTLRRLRDDYQRAGDMEGFAMYLDELRQRHHPQRCRPATEAVALFAVDADSLHGKGGKWRTRRQSEPAGQDGCDRAVLHQVPGCCVHSGCIRRKHDAAKATKKRSDEGRCHYRLVVTLTHSAWLVIRSLPVSKPASR